MTRRHNLLYAPQILTKKAITNWPLKIIMAIVIISIITDLSLLKLYDLTPKNPYPRDKLLIFSCLSATFIIAQIFILNYIKRQDTRFTRSRHFRVIHTTITVLQWILVLIIFLVNFQMWLESRFDVISIIVGITVSYGLGMIMTGYLSYRFFIWLRSNHGITILLYLLSSALITTSAFFTLIFLDSVSSLSSEVTPRIVGTALFLTQFQDTSLLITNILAIMSFIFTWLATAVLLSYRSSHMGRIKYWIIVVLPLVYFLSQFLSLFTSGFAAFVYGDPVTFGIILTIIFTFSKLAGGILFGFAFWKMANTIAGEFVVARNLVKFAGYGYVILFMSTQTVAFSIIPYPPFGFITILFFGISSYMILVGVYFSVIVISQDSRLRKTIKKITDDQPALLADISYAQVEVAIEKRAMRLAQRFEVEPNMVIETSHDVDMKDYAMSVINEVRSYDQIYSNIIDREKEILSHSQLFLMCIDGRLLEFIGNDQLAIFRDIMDMHRKGKHKGIRLITSIDSSLIQVVEGFLSMEVEVKHISNVTSRQFVVSEVAVLEIPNLEKNLNLEQKLQVKHDPTLVRSYLESFEGLWKSAIDARTRISELKSNPFS
ncbi:MAG: hypothetical protein WBX01_09185 [Nitrososphaeraceae archaeon]